MNYNILLDLATDLGYELAMSGAETFRVEDSIHHVLNSYHVNSDVFAIPNYLVVSITDENGKPYTKMRRIGYHGNNLDAVERFNALSRKICSDPPEPEAAMEWLDQVRRSVLHFSFPTALLGNFMGAFGFAILFGCNAPDAVIAGICGIIIGVVDRFMTKMKTNLLFSTFAGSFLMACFAYILTSAGIAQNGDAINIGALMILVPGLLFTNALRDIIYGDTNSGINRIVQVILIAVAIAMGNAFAWNVVSQFFPVSHSISASQPPLYISSIGALLGCFGFSVLFNIHGPGGLLCSIGGISTWVIYNLSLRFGCGELMSYFYATAFAAFYSESMARIRKYPTISYLVVSIFPLIPGAGVYYTMRHVLDGNMEMFVKQGVHTAAVAGIMAIGILLISTTFRLYTEFQIRMFLRKK